ncbi:hypothetical protein M422DRAFT_230846 [Sphaerobolus stellatus SS14]|uniref:Hemerythrin-like domain-containing protein n=1 Tax=Sphaerobolus stellatus (strain SS14) TaxID=990650 RepID=A0A0C9UVV6_SPHS4|nr:hypothetical protein M422DRAFT_230846 [Sphaerobolus stellatus SS14]
MATTSNMLDVQQEILIDHRNVRNLWERYQAEKDHDEKMRIANTLVREMAIHGDAEELSYYKFLAEHGKGDVVQHSKEEHHEIKRLVHDADTTTAGPDFDAKIAKAFQAFDTHAREEEESILPEMEKNLTSEEKDREARNFLKAREMAPPRAHPSAPQSGGIPQKLAGMQANLHDKVVNTIRGTEYVPLKEQHPETF